MDSLYNCVQETLEQQQSSNPLPPFITVQKKHQSGSAPATHGLPLQMCRGKIRVAAVQQIMAFLYNCVEEILEWQQSGNPWPPLTNVQRKHQIGSSPVTHGLPLKLCRGNIRVESVQQPMASVQECVKEPSEQLQPMASLYNYIEETVVQQPTASLHSCVEETVKLQQSSNPWTPYRTE